MAKFSEGRKALTCSALTEKERPRDMVRPALTSRQQSILDFVRGRPLPPTFREICAEFGFRSPFACYCHLNALQRKGYIARQEFTARGITVIDPQPE